MKRTVPLAALSCLLLLGVLPACFEDAGSSSGDDDTDDSSGDGDGDGDGDGTGDGDGDGDGGEDCGDGVVDEGEACDDGNDSNEDNCLNDCTEASCGDGFVGPGEGCDDGNEVDDDECSNDCALTSCGDGELQAGEVCDDGNDDNTDACLDTCVEASCGDGFTWTDEEQCDDGNADNTDACPDTCESAACGDGFTWTDEEDCDDGNADNTDACLDSCESASCGDGFQWAGEEECDDGDDVADDECDNECLLPACGDEEVEGDEQCDDGNDDEGDGCDPDCSYTQVLYVDASWQNVCALIEGGRVRCWGYNGQGQLGYGHTETVGDDETPADEGDVQLPEPGVQLSMGDQHTCVLLEEGGVRCWGMGSFGKLGYGNTNHIGDDEFPIDILDVNMGGAGAQVAAGGQHTCAKLTNGKLRCWGMGANGALGYGNTNDIGDNEAPAVAGDVPVGAALDAIATGIGHTCALLASGSVRCWGANYAGQLGNSSNATFGDNEPASASPTVLLQADAMQIAMGLSHSCARLDGGTAMCWGAAGSGQSGQGTTNNIGDNESVNSYPVLSFDEEVVHITTGDNHSCVLFSDQTASCWGFNGSGQLGYGNTTTIGDNENAENAGLVDIGGPIVQIDAGGDNTCAIRDDNEVFCWGDNSIGQLGYGNTANIGDNELPVTAGPIDLL